MNQRSKQKDRTPLHWAIVRNNFKIVDYLLQMGADREAVDEEGFSPMELAITKECYEAALALKKAGFEIREPEYYHDKMWRPFDVELFI